MSRFCGYPPNRTPLLIGCRDKYIRKLLRGRCVRKCPREIKVPSQESTRLGEHLSMSAFQIPHATFGGASNSPLRICTLLFPHVSKTCIPDSISASIANMYRTRRILSWGYLAEISMTQSKNITGGRYIYLLLDLQLTRGVRVVYI